MNDECPLCDRLLPPDGDCYGCAADKAWEEIAALRERLARAEAVCDAIVAEREADDDRPGTPYGPEQTDDHDAAVERTDAALEAAKEAG
jgi:hypothetical protein